MPLACNINRRGRLARTVLGLLLLLAAVLLILALDATAPAWIAGICLAAGGAFCLFEAARGWCALRAMGWKTPL